MASDKDTEITVTLTLEQLHQLVVFHKVPLYLEHRYLCHPERDCEDGCDTPADANRLWFYQAGQGCDPAFGGERKGG
jgi:hypothetical protein